jgi:hypothetical protein
MYDRPLWRSETVPVRDDERIRHRSCHGGTDPERGWRKTYWVDEQVKQQRRDENREKRGAADRLMAEPVVDQ